MVAVVNHGMKIVSDQTKINWLIAGIDQERLPKGESERRTLAAEK